jgi:hypothetical protein
MLFVLFSLCADIYTYIHLHSFAGDKEKGQIR